MAIQKMDEAVQVFNPGDGPALSAEEAIDRMDAAVEVAESSWSRLARAAADCQRLHAFLADDKFMDWEASQNATPMGVASKHDTGESRFTQWVEFRYGYLHSQAGRLAQSGRILELLPENPPANERQARPLYPLLKAEAEDGDPGLVQRVWDAARAAAEAQHKPETVAAEINRIINSDPDIYRWKRTPVGSTKSDGVDDQRVERDVKRFRELFISLRRELSTADFNKRLIEWMEAEMDS